MRWNPVGPTDIYRSSVDFEEKGSPWRIVERSFDYFYRSDAESTFEGIDCMALATISFGVKPDGWSPTAETNETFAV